MMKTLLRLAPLALLLVGVAAAQSTGMITGTVIDGATGKPVVGAVVVATSPASPGEKSTVTDAKGAFSIAGLPAGKYKLQATLDGYNPETRVDLALGENVTLKADLAIVPEAVKLEEVVVTGSRIRRKDLTTPAPVTVINREQIQATGKLSIGDFLQALPEQGNAANTTFNNGGDGRTEISLRSLGGQRTLVLIDGKRFITGVPGGGNLGDPGTDLNSIPAGAVERIEVLKDGASAIYGSDAIGGVVNIITRKRLNGVEATAATSTSSRGDAGVRDVNVLAGASSDKGGFSLGAGYFRQEALFAAKRDWAKDALTYDYTAGQAFPGGSSRIPSGRAQVDPSACSTQLCTDLLAAYGPGKKQFMPASSTADPVNDPLVDGWRQYTGADAYNFQAVNYLITPSERYSLYANGDYNLNEYARSYFHATYVNRRSSNLLAPVPLDTGSFGLTMSGSNFYNPFGIDLLDVRRRFLESGGRSQVSDVDTVHTFFGLNGTLPKDLGPLERWNWDLSVGYARNSLVQTTRGSINTALTGNAIGPSSADGTQCLTAPGGAVIPNCTPANWFNAGTTPMTQAMAASLGSFTGTNQGSNQVVSFDANLGGELFKLMADHPVALALGYSYRTETGEFTYNPVAVQGLDSDYNGQNTKGSYHINEGYAELNIPILSNMPFIESLEAVAAARVSNYSSFGSTTTYKVGAMYTPVRDFSVRGTVSTGFRAPGITSLFGGQGPNAEAASDPCGTGVAAGSALATQCAANLARGGGGAVAVNNGDDNTQILSTSGGNTALKPEKADIFTVGLVFQPSMVKGLSLTADYYGIDIRSNIGFITTPVILAGCYPGAGGTPNQAFCDLVKRGPNGQIRDVTDVLQNVGKLSTQGLDLAGRYVLPTDFGQLGFQVDANVLFKYNQTLSDGTVVKGLNTYDLGVLPRYKFNLGVSYAMSGFTAALRGRYVAGFHECADASQGGISDGSGLCYVPANQAFPVHQVPFYQTYDVHLAYALKYGFGTATISGGMRNILDQKPAPVYNTAAQTNSDPSTYDYVGRVFYVALQQKI
jgi:outer membrane receptor protein involved in Fe transport